MEFKYYDVLSNLVVGYVLLVIGMYAFQIEYNSDYTVAYLAMAFLCGYLINAVSSLLEPVFYFTIGGKPSIDYLMTAQKSTESSITCLFHETQELERFDFMKLQLLESYYL